MNHINNIEVAKPGAPDLVLDLLEANAAALSAHAICRAGALLGHTESAMRVALTRLAADQKIQREARGSYALNQPGLPLTATLGAWSQEASTEIPWHGDWIAVHDTEVARSDKALWRRHQLALSLRGFAPLRHGLQLHPCNRQGGVAAEYTVLQTLGLAPQAIVCRLDHLDKETQQQARALWPVKQLEARYRALLKALTQHARALPKMPIEQALRESLLLGRTAISMLIRDPMLPAPLMQSATRNALAASTLDYQRVGRGLWLRWLNEE